jgi:hypothetical protein
MAGIMMVRKLTITAGRIKLPLQQRPPHPKTSSSVVLYTATGTASNLLVPIIILASLQDAEGRLDGRSIFGVNLFRQWPSHRTETARRLGQLVTTELATGATNRVKSRHSPFIFKLVSWLTF